MSRGTDHFEEHEKFRQLCALSTAGNLTPSEAAELNSHIEGCDECRTALQEYRLVTGEGMPMLAVRFDRPKEATAWDNSNLKSSVLERFEAAKAKRAVPQLEPRAIPVSEAKRHLWSVRSPVLKFGVAACFLVAFGWATYRAGRIEQVPPKQTGMATDSRYAKLVSEKQALENLLSADDLRLKRLDAETAKQQGELAKVRGELRANEEHTNTIATAKDSSDQQLQSVMQERDALNKKFADARQALQNIQSELTNLKTERDQATMRSVALQRQVDDLAAENANQQRRIGNQDHYLSADRDIRELMGARKLYIADVFDVSSDSRTRKPYGRVFYTQGKSLIFYAFDLDHQPHVQEASTFQVWGKNESAQDRPVNLGVLYMDSAANRRWALRCNDPQQLAEIDAVFVTVEPNAHGNKPTGKPFLYASLRKEPNHP